MMFSRFIHTVATITMALVLLVEGIPLQAQASYSACLKNNTQTCIYHDPLTGKCDEYSNSYTCYKSGSYKNSCANENMSGYYQVGPNRVNVQYPNGNSNYPPTSYDTFYSTNGSCSPVPSGNCGSMYNVQPEGNVSGYTYDKACYAGSKTTSSTSNTCNPNPKACTSVVSNICTATQDGICVKRQLTYNCGSDTTACNNVKSGPSSSIKSKNNGMKNFISHMSLAREIAKNASFVNGQLRIFGGSSDNCHFITKKALTYIQVASAITTVLLTIFTAGAYAATAGVVSTYGVMVLGTMHCCATNPSNINTRNGLCTVKDIRLSNARKKKLAFRVDTSGNHTDDGDGSKYDCINDPSGIYPETSAINPKNLSNCALADLTFQATVINTQTWCYFPNKLAKIIQVQGRQQLKKLAVNNAAGAVQQTISYKYYGGPSGQGAWTSPINVNGNKVSAWQWPSDCANPNTSGTSTLAGLCPGQKSDWIAICSSNNGTCATSPGGSPSNSGPNTGWSFVPVNTAQTTPTTLNRYAVTEGTCTGANNDGACSYTIHAFPAGVGGTLHVNINLNWPEKYPASTGWNPDFVFNSPVGTNILFQAYTWNNSLMGNKYPMIRYSLNGGASWSSGIKLPNPESSMNFALPGGPSKPPMTVYGGCNNGQCKYTLSYGVKVTTKPWGYYTWQKHNNCLLTIPNILFGSNSYWVNQSCDSRSGCTTTKTSSGICVASIPSSYNYVWHPDCSGFTLTQLESLDFAKMNFSSYLNSLKPSNPVASTSQSQQMYSTAQSRASSIQHGGSTAPSKDALNTNNATFELNPHGAVWPGTKVDLVAKTSYPVTETGKSTLVPVTGITVNWGDGSSSSMSIPSSPSPTVTLKHVYGSTGCSSAQSNSCSPSPSTPTTYKVSVTFQTAQGDYTNTGTVQVSTQGDSSPGNNSRFGNQTHGTVKPN